MLAFSIHIGVLAATIGLLVNGYDVFPVDFSGLPLILTNDQVWTRGRAFTHREKVPNYIPRETNDGLKGGFWHKGRIIDSLEVIFQIENGDIFSEENLNLISSAENKLFNADGFEIYCLAERNGNCKKPASVLRYFDGTYEAEDASFKTTSYRNASDILCKAYTNRNTTSDIKLYLSKDFNPCNPGDVSTYTRLFLHFGHGTRSKSRKTFQLSTMKSIVTHIKDVDLKGHMEVYYISNELLVADLSTQATTDMWWGAGSGIFIILVMWIQTGSLWITFMGLYSIVTSYLIANFIYRYCFGYIYFGFFHMAAMFIIIGIGADDVFVFYDTWRLTAHRTFPSKAHRLSEFYKIASKTTFITSLTTSAAFLAALWSPLLPVKTFGLFSALLVSVNYLFDLIYFPTSVMLHSEKIEPCFKKLYSCCCSSVIQRVFKRRNQNEDKCEKDPNNNAQTQDVSKNSTKKFLPVVFFQDKFYRFVTWPPIKIGVPVFFIALTIFFAVWASKVEANTDDVSNHSIPGVVHVEYFNTKEHTVSQEPQCAGLSRVFTCPPIV